MPRTDTVETIVYKFSELSPDAQQKAIDKKREELGEMLETSIITEAMDLDLAELGYGDTKVEWSLGNCQGDGMAFYGTIEAHNLKRVIARILPGPVHKNDRAILYQMIKEDVITVKIVKNSYGWHYSHWNTMSVEIDCYHDQTVRREGLIEVLRSGIKDDIQAISRKLEKEGYENIEYETSEERAKEELIDEGVEFYESGKVYD